MCLSHNWIWIRVIVKYASPIPPITFQSGRMSSPYLTGKMIRSFIIVDTNTPNHHGIMMRRNNHIYPLPGGIRGNKWSQYYCNRLPKYKTGNKGFLHITTDIDLAVNEIIHSGFDKRACSTPGSAGLARKDHESATKPRLLTKPKLQAQHHRQSQ